MAKAITYNNAGIVEAIKRNSGSTKFYKPNFQGIIEAIEDWQGGSGDGTGGIDAGSSVLPEGGDLPNTNNKQGDLVVIPNGDGDYFMYVFANGSWERLHITTEEVETAGSAPFVVELPDGTILKNQANINAYLDERITELSEKGYDDRGIKAELAQEVTDRTEGDQALRADLDQEILDREADDQTLQDQIDALEAYNDSALTARVENLEEAVEYLPTWIAEAPPENKEDGDLWFDSGDTGQLYVRYGGEWVVACPPVTDDDLAGTVSDVEALAQTAMQKANLVEYSLYQQGELLKWDQERQDSQIYELEEEIESLAPSFDRGKWELVSGEPVGPGQYAMAIGVDSEYCQYQYMKCLAEAGDDETAKSACLRAMGDCESAATEGDGEFYMNDWAHAKSLHFSTTDIDDKEHTFADYNVGKFIDLFDQGDTGYAVFEITAEPVIENGIASIAVTPIQHEGEASGVARLKVFQAGEIDTSNFVRKTGDTITGGLRLYPDSTSNPFTINSFDEGPDRAMVVNVRGKTKEDGTRPSIFTVLADGCVNIDDDVPITSKWQVPHKKYVDESFVSKKGDTINGFTKIKPGEGGKSALYVIAGPASVSNQIVFKVGDKNETSNLYVTEEGKVGVRDDYSVVSANTLTNKEYVDKAIAEAMKDVTSPLPKPAQASWIYGGNATVRPPSYYFYQSGNNFYLSLNSNNGLRISSDSEKSWGPANGSAFEMSFWRPNGSLTNEWKMIKHVELDKVYWQYKDSNGNYCLRFHMKWESNKLTFNTQTEYHITVGGFF